MFSFPRINVQQIYYIRDRDVHKSLYRQRRIFRLKGFSLVSPFKVGLNKFSGAATDFREVKGSFFDETRKRGVATIAHKQHQYLILRTFIAVETSRAEEGSRKGRKESAKRSEKIGNLSNSIRFQRIKIVGLLSESEAVYSHRIYTNMYASKQHFPRLQMQQNMEQRNVQKINIQINRKYICNKKISIFNAKF